MNPLQSRSRPLRIGILGVALFLMLSHRGFSQGASEPAPALELLFDLGLADTKSAQWVNAAGDFHVQSLFDEGGWDGSGPVKGNGWILREAKGEVELLLVDGKRVRATVMKEGGVPETPSDLPGVMIKPADWKKDSSDFLGRLRKIAESRKTATEGNEYRFSSAKAQCGEAVLFLAHAQRRGDVALVREALPMVFDLAGGAEAALDDAVGTLADQQLGALFEAWQKGKDAQSYAAEIDAVVARYSRGWRKRSAAQQLAQRLRTPRVQGRGDKEVSEVAKMFLALKPEEFAQLPFARLWLLPSSGEEDDSMAAQRRYYMRRSSRQNGDESDAKMPPVLEKLFVEPRRAARIMAQLLGDQRMMRVGLEYGGGSYSFSFDDDDFGDESLKRSYGSIARPKELGEVCAELLTSVMPEGMRSQVGDLGEGSSLVMAWLDRVSGLDHDALAWEYLRGSDSVSDQHFQAALAYLVASGSDESRAQLDEVFVDPAVWSRDSDQMVAAVEKHASRRKGDGEVFRQKLIDAVKAGQEQMRSERARYSGSGDSEYAKQLAMQEAALLKKIEQVFKPTTLADLLQQVLDAPEEEAMLALQSVGPAMKKVKTDEAHAQMLQAAARAKSAQVKSGLLQMIAQSAWEMPRKGSSEQPFDEKTKEALSSLLKDETALPQRGWAGGRQIIADITASTLIMVRAPNSHSESVWTFAQMAGPRLARALFREQASAIAEGKPLPAMPDLTKVPKDATAKLLAEIGAASVEEGRRIFESKPFEQQLALVAHLQEPATEWPASVKSAHLTVAAVNLPENSKFPAGPWKGRLLDAALCAEIEKAVDAAAREGTAVIAMVDVQDVFAGVTISITENSQRVPKSRLAGLQPPLPDAGPPPDALVTRMIYGRDRAVMMYPLWKDEAATRAWKDKHGKAKEPAGDAEPDENVQNAAKLARAQAGVFAVAPEWRRASMAWQAALFRDSTPAAAAAEDVFVSEIEE